MAGHSYWGYIRPNGSNTYLGGFAVMPCYKPVQATQCTHRKTKNGKPLITFEKGADGMPISLPCGQCIGCKITRSKEWAIRGIHEASLYPDNCFITLTYNDENVPLDGSLVKSHFQKFMKKLRKKFVPINPYNKKTQENKWLEFHEKHQIRYYMCGEYGDKNNRPHYHSILYNFNFKDWVYLFDSPSGFPIYTSPTLESIWAKGFVTIGTVDFQSIAYIARYVIKKINGEKAEEINEHTGLRHYDRVNPITGEIHAVLPEYTDMSRRPGIGNTWINNYTTDCYPKDFTTVHGMRVKPPRYYDKQLEQIDPLLYEDIKNGRIEQAIKSEENSQNRLRQKEIVAKSKQKHLKRQL